MNERKAVIIGAGFVGSASAFALLQSGLFTEIVLIDNNQAKAEGEAMDISHGVPFCSPVDIHAGGYEDAADAGIIIITAGAAQRPGETRLDLVSRNAAIFRSIIPNINESGFQGVLLIVANPVDILTYIAQKLSNLPANRVIGSGTTLDTARLKSELSKHLNVDARSIHSFIIGEHGDSEIVAWSSANVSGVPIGDFCELRGHYHNHHQAMEKIAAGVRDSAYRIIERKGATYYGIAMSIRRICEAIVNDEKSIFPVSNLMTGAYGIEDIVLSMPAILGRDGIETQIPISLNEKETVALMKSAKTLKEIADKLDLENK
ncbi:MAG: L-lactate dehydrogenase [Erysipelotrichaceae bacterium]|nr:L-lactate dehydrogenase [Erysipelotrichaceae bacterium]